MRIVVGVLLGLLVVVVGCQREDRPLPPKRERDFSLEVQKTGGVMGIHDAFRIEGNLLSVSGFGGVYDVELTDAELDAIYEKTLAITRVQNRPPHRNDISDDFYGSMVATIGTARYEVTRAQDASDVLGLAGMLSGLARARAIGPVDFPAVRPDDFWLSIAIPGFRGNQRGHWSAIIDPPRRSFVRVNDGFEVAIHPTSDELDRLYATCRAIAASSTELQPAGRDDDEYFVIIVAGRRQRVFTGSISSLPIFMRAKFETLRPTLEAFAKSGR